MNTKLYCWIGLALYAALSAADYAFTYSLIDGSGGDVAEANPVAAAWLEHHGWGGLAVFKAAGVLLFVASTGLLVPRRPRLAAAVIALGCLVLTGVTTYSRQLIASTYPSVYYATDVPARAVTPRAPSADPDPVVPGNAGPEVRDGVGRECVVCVKNCGANGEAH